MLKTLKKHALSLATVLIVLYLIMSWLTPPESHFGEKPALHNGRIKPIDTIARTFLLQITGKQTVRTDNHKLSHLEWLELTWTAPEEANKVPVFKVQNPTLIQFISGTPDKKAYFSYNTLKPKESALHNQALTFSNIDQKLRNAYQKDVIKLSNALIAYTNLQASYPDPEKGKRFLALAKKYAPTLSQETLPKSLYSNPEFIELSSLFHTLKQDTERGNIHLVYNPETDSWETIGNTLLQALDNKPVPENMFNLEPDITPHTLEYKFNHFNPFYKAIVIYLIVFLGISLYWMLDSVWLLKVSSRLAVIGFGIHTFGIICRMLIQGRPPVTNLYTSSVFVGWTAILVALIIEKIHKNGIGNFVSAIIGFITLIIAHHLSLSGDTLEMMQAVLDSNFWLSTHVVTIAIGYGGTILAGVLAHVYVFSRNRNQQLVKMVFGASAFALLFMVIGTILGGIWADQSWGRFWGWDPKENGALLIILWIAIMLHARLSGWCSSYGFIRLAIGANIVTAFSWFGVNLLGIGLHSYGFTESGFFWLTSFSLFELLIISLPQNLIKQKK